MCLPAHAKITYLVFLVFTPTNKPTSSVSSAKPTLKTSDEPGQHSLVWVDKTNDLTFPCGAPVSVLMVGDTYLIYHSMIYHWKRTQPLWWLRCRPFSVTTFALCGLSLWNPDGKSTNRAHTYVFVLVQMTVYYMHHVLFLLVGPVFFFCMSLRTPFSQKLMLLDNNHLKPRGCDVFEGGAIDDGFTGSGNTLLPSTLPVNPSGLAAFLILIFLKRWVLQSLACQA